MTTITPSTSAATTDRILTRFSAGKVSFLAIIMADMSTAQTIGTIVQTPKPAKAA